MCTVCVLLEGVGFGLNCVVHNKGCPGSFQDRVIFSSSQDG